MVNPLQVVFGLLLVMFIPGYTLVQLMFPRRGELDDEFDKLYRAPDEVVDSVLDVLRGMKQRREAYCLQVCHILSRPCLIHSLWLLLVPSPSWS